MRLVVQIPVESMAEASACVAWIDNASALWEGHIFEVDD